MIYHCLFPENYTRRQFLNSSFAEKAYGLLLAIPGILYSLYIREHAIPGEKKGLSLPNFNPDYYTHCLSLQPFIPGASVCHIAFSRYE